MQPSCVKILVCSPLLKSQHLAIAEAYLHTAASLSLGRACCKLNDRPALTSTRLMLYDSMALNTQHVLSSSGNQHPEVWLASNSCSHERCANAQVWLLTL